MQLRVLIFACLLRITKSETECKPSGRGEDYRGYLSTTVNGRECQLWSAQTPHRHTQSFPDGLSAQSNYCRNPSYEANGPWCYTTDPDVILEYCDLPLCSNPQPVASWIFDEDHRGVDTSFLGLNPISINNSTYGTGINEQPNGAILLPTYPYQSIVVANPTQTMRFKNELSFIAHLYLVGNIGPIFEYNNLNGNENRYMLSLYVWPDARSLRIHLRYGPYNTFKEYSIVNVLKDRGWHRIGFSITKNEVRGYVNGSFVHQSNDGYLPNYPTQRGLIFFGSVPGNAAQLGGRMACAKFYDVSLSDTQMASVECKNMACTKVADGRCVGNCLGFNVGDACDEYLYPLRVLQISAATKPQDTKTIDVIWKMATSPKEGTRNLYKLTVLYRQKNLINFQTSPEIQIRDEDMSTHVYKYTIDDLNRDTEYEIAIRTTREVGDFKDHHQSKIVAVRIPCIYPEIPSGLNLTKSNDDTFVVAWTSNLAQLASGCSSKTVSLYFKYTDADLWVVNVVALSLSTYSFPARGHEDCFVKISVVNNVEMESQTVVITRKNATEYPVVNIPTTMLTYPGGNDPLDGGLSANPSGGQQSSTPQESVVIADKQTQEGNSQIVLILAVFLAVVGVVMVVGIIVAAVCWRRSSEFERQSHTQRTTIENLKLKLATTQAGNRKAEHAPNVEPVSWSDETYEEIAEKGGARGLGAKQYESLEVAVYE